MFSDNARARLRPFGPAAALPNQLRQGMRTDLVTGAQKLAEHCGSVHERKPMTAADRLSRVLSAALHSPDFAVRFLSRAPAAERAELLRRWAQAPAGDLPRASTQPERPQPTAPAEPRPGLRKCGAPRPATQSHDLALQLAAFSRSVGRVG
jgi:hypothetical protein